MADVNFTKTFYDYRKLNLYDKTLENLTLNKQLSYDNQWSEEK